MIFLFWLCVFLIAHTYFLYPLTLPMLFRLFPKSRKAAGPIDHKVSILISAYNEEKILPEKIENCLELDYPRADLEVLIGSDGSSDGTNAILAQYQNHPVIKGVVFETRSGKASVLNRLAEMATGGILVFCDANSMFLKNTLQKLLTGFQDEKVGCVCGRLVLKDSTDTSLGKGESIYWSMESEIKKMEGQLGVVIGSNGAVYAVPKKIFPTIPENTNVADDFYVAIPILKQGHWVIYEPMALATEETSVDKYGEFKRKVRIGEANFNMLSEYVPLLNLKYPFAAYSFFSHKLLRWFAPTLMLFIFLLNLGILFRSDTQFVYFAAMLLQGSLYGLAVAGYGLNRGDRKSSMFFTLPFYFVSMNAALFVGMLKSFFGSNQATWDRVERTQTH